jgi:hypothetical protein
VIVPTDPPGFAGCIAQVRAQIPGLSTTSDATIRKDCAQLFTSLASQTLAFLIQSDWYLDYAAQLKIVVTNAQVNHELALSRKQEFPTSADFAAFLSQTGQTVQDILFRIRVDETYRDLVAAVHGAPKLQALIKRRYLATTHCQRLYAMNLCVKDTHP